MMGPVFIFRNFSAPEFSEGPVSAEGSHPPVPAVTCAVSHRCALLREALVRVQWAGRDRFRCVECEGQPSTGHTPMCLVGRVLALTGERP